MDLILNMKETPVILLSLSCETESTKWKKRQRRGQQDEREEKIYIYKKVQSALKCDLFWQPQP